MKAFYKMPAWAWGGSIANFIYVPCSVSVYTLLANAILRLAQ